MIPAYINAGAGASATTSPVAVPYPTGITAGNLLILQVSVRNLTSVPTDPSGWTLLYGPDTSGTSVRQWIYGKIADGTESGELSLAHDASIVVAARIYLFRSVLGTSYTEGGSTTNISGSIVYDAGVTTSGANRLAVNFVAISDNNTGITAFVGETGGDWTEAVAEYSFATGLDGTLQLQTAAMVSSGTIDGGSYTMQAADAGIIRGFALIGSPDVLGSYISSNEGHYTGSLKLNILGSYISSSEINYPGSFPSGVQVIDGAYLSSAETHYAGSLNLNIDGAYLSSAETHYAGSLNLNIDGAYLSSAETHYAGSLNLNIDGAYLSSAETHYAGIISSGIQIFGNYLSSNEVHYAGSLKLNIDGAYLFSSEINYAGNLISETQILGSYLSSSEIHYPGQVGYLQQIFGNYLSSSEAHYTGIISKIPLRLLYLELWIQKIQEL